MTDANFVRAFEMVLQLKKYLSKTGDPLQYCFRLGEAFGMNTKTKHRKEVLEYRSLMTEINAVQLHMAEPPGMFVLLPGSYTLTNPLSQKMWNATRTGELTHRLMIEKLSATSPKGSTLVNDALTKLLKGTFTAAEAAACVQSGLEPWYIPGV